MTVTPTSFEAYLKCPTKCFLKSRRETDGRKGQTCLIWNTHAKTTAAITVVIVAVELLAWKRPSSIEGVLNYRAVKIVDIVTAPIL